MCAAAAAANATIDSRQCVGGEADAFAVGVRVVDADAAGGCGAGVIPAGVIDVKGRCRHLIEFDQTEINVGFRGAESCTTLILSHRAAQAVAAAGWRLKVPINDDGRGVAGGNFAVIGSEKEGAKIRRRVHDKSAAAKTDSADADHANASYLVCPGRGNGADDVDFACLCFCVREIFTAMKQVAVTG